MTGNQMKRYREAHGWSQQELAQRLGRSIAWIQSNEQRKGGQIADGLAEQIRNLDNKDICDERSESVEWSG